MVCYRNSNQFHSGGMGVTLCLVSHRVFFFCSKDGAVDGMSDVCGTERSRRPELSMSASRLDSKEGTVSQLLQSLRNESQRAERLQKELQDSAAR